MLIIPAHAVPMVNLGAYVTSLYVTKAANDPDSALSKAIGSNGRIGDVARKNDMLISPAKWALRIWVPIYALEAASVLWQVAKSEPIPRGLIDASPWWVAASVCQATWVCVFVTEKTSGQLSIVPMAGIAYSLWQVVTSTRSIVASETTAFVLGRIPYSIHFSWVGCAAILNLNTAIASSGAGSATQHAAGLISEVAAALIGSYISITYEDPIPALVTAWALLAISKDRDGKPRDPQISTTALVGSMATGAVGVSIVLKWLGAI